MKPAKLKWEAVDFREYIETTTLAMQYHWQKGGRFLRSAGHVVGSRENPWLGEIMVNGEWAYVNSYHSAREARAAVVAAFEKSRMAAQ